MSNHVLAYCAILQTPTLSRYYSLEVSLDKLAYCRHACQKEWFTSYPSSSCATYFRIMLGWIWSKHGNFKPVLLPDVSLHTALSSELVLHQVGVVGRWDEIMTEWLSHVLKDPPLLWVKNGAFSWAEVHQKAIKCHGIHALGWNDSKMVSMV